jgi:hypothetical protein
MHIAHAAFLVTLSCSPCLVLAEGAAAAQSPELKPAAAGQAQAAQPAVAPPAVAPPAAASAPSAMLLPSLDTLKETIGGLKLEKWKSGSVRTEATANVSSIQRDLQETLPGILKVADAAPNSLSSLLPVYRNVVALYDVVLRVYDAARVSGPVDQVAALQAAMSSLEGGRRSLNDRLMGLSTAQEKQISQLQGSLQNKPAPPVCPVVAPPPPPAPAKKPLRKKKPAATTDQPAKTPAAGTGAPKPTTPQ